MLSNSFFSEYLVIGSCQISRHFRAHALAILSFCVLATLVGCSSASLQREADIVQERFRSMPAQDDVVAASDWYQPTATVRGAIEHDSSRRGQQRDDKVLSNSSPISRLQRPDDIDVDIFQSSLSIAKAYDTLALVVLYQGNVVLEHHSDTVATNTRYDTQSMHRGLVSLAVLAAIEDGYIQTLDTPASRWLHEWRIDSRSQITVRDLLLGQSGLRNPPYENRPDSAGLQLFIGTRLRELVTSQPAEAPRATRWRGNALDAQALGLILETATGKSYASYLSSRLWQPLGAGDAQVQLDRQGGNTRTFCCLKASAYDWAWVGELVRTRGTPRGKRILKESSIRELLTPSALNRTQGMSWLLEPVALIPRSLAASTPKLTPFADPEVVYIGGRGGQRVYVLPGQCAVVVRIGRIRNDFDDGRFLNPFIDALKTLSTNPATACERAIN